MCCRKAAHWKILAFGGKLLAYSLASEALAACGQHI
jgi:hypothetical protein